MLLDEKIDRALAFAARAHADQRRKTDPTLPYIAHPASVGFALSRAGFPEDVVAAGILHDVVEDCGVSPEKMRAEFGDRVAELVAAVSEDKRDPWEKRKADYKARVLAADPEVKALAAADKLHNVRCLLELVHAGQSLDGLFKRDGRTTVEGYASFAAALRDTWDHPLADELLAATEELSAAVR